MAALICTLAWLPLVLSALNVLPPAVNLNLSSVRFHNTLTWEPGAGTPDGIRYTVSIHTESGTSWLPVVGCQHVQPPVLACDLTLDLSDPHQKYLANVTGLLEGWAPGSAVLENIDLMRDTVLDPPRLVVTRCEQGALCVDVLPPVEDLRTVYQELELQLLMQTGDTLEKMKLHSLGIKKHRDLMPGRLYCFSVCFLDRDGCSPAVCNSTDPDINLDTLISSLLCLLVLPLVAYVALQVYTRFPSRVPLPSLLTSLTHLDVTLLFHCPSETSLLSVCVAAPPSGTLPSLLDCSDDDNVTESHREGAGAEGEGERGGNYRGWLGTNLPSVQVSPQPIAGPTISTESSAADTQEEVVVEVGTQNMYLQPLTMNTCRRPEEEPSSVPLEVNLLTLTFGAEHKPKEKEEKDEQDKEETKPPSVPLGVNLFTLTFGSLHDQKEKEEEEESHPPSQLTAGAEGVEQWTLEGEREEDEEEEEEEEEEPDYIGRSYFSRQN